MSKEVDVFVVDLLPDQPLLVTQHIRDIGEFQQIAAEVIPKNVELRLFFMEDMTALVVEALGSALRCRPYVFADYIQLAGMNEIINAETGEFIQILLRCGENTQIWSDHSSQTHFSFLLPRGYI